MKLKLGLLPKIALAIILGILAGKVLPEGFIRLFSTFNGIFGNFINFVIPLIIIGFIAPGIGQVGKGAGRLLGLSTAVAYLSTIAAGLLAYFAGTVFLPGFVEGHALSNMGNPEEFLQKPFFEVNMPPFMDVVGALLLAFILGIGMASIKGTALVSAMEDFRKIVEKLIAVVIIPLLPFHIFGIFSNMTFGGQVESILSVFAKVFALIIGLHIIMLVLQYTAAGAAVKGNPIKLLKTMLPAYFTALGTQSSAATIPVTLDHVKKTKKADDQVADFTIPLFATIHLSGSTITLVSCAMGVMLLSGVEPTFQMLLPFILMLGVTMIAAPGVPGGAVMAALGPLKTMLGFDATMVALMIALYLAQDSFGTATNVTGDGALAILLSKIGIKKKPALSAKAVS
ncbi:cation:dicarboxylase symporter family transporter [Bacillus mangrovi]|uniref:Cation:dicarboxylase symporter family transporter n=1 Tax=Metabacillus mangrovi TaxID=1491830 RepID=A0A7X2V557_9BACI|nr:dicarboxylate/amino acid:cation symporter [Metabacillus mangrovi]MTH54462.1 cation:dicarboxylase symporter family transporter [Metabacillus mangrovi]